MAANAGGTLLTVDGLSVVRADRVAISDVSFAAAPGDLIAIVGPNGAGKSTLLSVLLGLLPVAGGRFAVRGAFAYVPQHQPGDRAFPVTALDVVLMGLYRDVGLWRRIGGAQKRRALVALDRVGLAGEARRSFGELSGGQRQRVMLARALVREAEVLLLDEPLSGVDAVSEEAIMQALVEERAEGRAVLMATHDLALARARCTQALLLNGHAYAFGPPAEALTAETLRAAYGSRLIVLDDRGGLDAIDEGSHHEHRGSGE
jgi:ABC-type Mn2+/Zn2+ transport system ATPase subunit